MSEVAVTLMVPEEIAKFIRENGLSELVFRRRDAKFKYFYKAKLAQQTDPARQEELLKHLSNLFSDVSSRNENGLNRVHNVLKELRDGQNALSENAKMELSQLVNMADGISHLANLQYLQIGLSCVNIAVDVAGFMIIYQKLSEVEAKIAELGKDVAKIHTMKVNEIISKFKQLHSQFSSLTEKIRDNDRMDRDKLEQFLFDVEKFIDEQKLNFMSDSIYGEIALEMITSLLNCHTVILGAYLRDYFFEKQKLPGIYDSYLSVYDELLKESFYDKIAEDLFVNRGMSYAGTIEANNAQKIVILENLTKINDLSKLLRVTKTKERYDEVIQAVDMAAESAADADIEAFLAQAAV